MKLKNKYKIERAASNDETRYEINNIKINGEKKQLIATNGKILACVPVEIEKDDDIGSGVLTKGAIIEARKQGKRSGMTEIKLNGSFEMPNKAQLPRPDKSNTGVFPYYEQAIPKRKTHFAVTINPDLLMDLVKALGHEHGNGVTLEFSKDNLDSIVVRTDTESIGVMIPMKKL